MRNYVHTISRDFYKNASKKIGAPLLGLAKYIYYGHKDCQGRGLAQSYNFSQMINSNLELLSGSQWECNFGG